MSSRPRHGEAGFLAIDALVAVVLGLLALAALTTLHVGQMYAMSDQAKQVELQGSARDLADLFAREVRRAGFGTNPSCTGSASTAVLLGNSREVRVRADLDGNGVLTGAGEDVTWKLDPAAATVTRVDNGQNLTETLWTGVSIGSSALSFFDGSGTLLGPGSTGLTAAQLVAIRRIRLNLALSAKTSQPNSAATQVALATADVELRNRRFGTDSRCPYG